MRKKIADFFRVMWIAALVAGGALILGGLTMSSLEVQCDLQEDQFYTCQSRDTFIGMTLSEASATQVYGIARDLTCGGAGKNKGCSAHAEFLTSPGDRIIASRRYTDPDQVQKAVSALDPLMAAKSTPIDMVFPPSTFVSVVIISLSSCVLIILLLVAFLMLFGKDVKDLRAGAIDLRKKN